MKRMQAKYRGTCTNCRAAIEVGQTIYWGKRSGACHVDCETARSGGRSKYANDNSGVEDRACSDMAYEDACARATEY